jgi:hypothetical protein
VADLVASPRGTPTADDVLALMAVFAPPAAAALRGLLDQCPALRTWPPFLDAGWAALAGDGTLIHQLYLQYLSTLPAALTPEQMRAWAELLRLLPAGQQP